jgi:hypothetical protein
MNAFPALSYRQVRIAWCKATLVSLLKRWGIYIAVGLLILGGGGASALAAMMAMAAWSVTPLFQAAQQSALHGAVAALGYAVLGGLIVLGLSPWLWPRAWAEAERALPIGEPERRRSDFTVVMLGLTPLFAIYLLGTVIWLVQFPAWLQPVWVSSTSMLAVSMGLSAAMGVAVLQWRRRLPPKSTSGWAYRVSQRRAGLGLGNQQRVSSVMALVVMPLARGPAQRSGRFLTWTLVAMASCVVALIGLQHFASWWLAAFAAISQAMVTRLSVVVAADMEPLHEAGAALPISPVWLKVARRAVVMLPLVAGQLFLILAVNLGAAPVKPTVFSMYLLASLLGNLALVVAASAPPVPGVREDPVARVSWWLVILVLTIALGSEVVV